MLRLIPETEFLVLRIEVICTSTSLASFKSAKTC